MTTNHIHRNGRSVSINAMWLKNMVRSSMFYREWCTSADAWRATQHDLSLLVTVAVCAVDYCGLDFDHLSPENRRLPSRLRRSWGSTWARPIWKLYRRSSFWSYQMIKSSFSPMRLFSGMAGYVDRLILGSSHLYNGPTCKEIYETKIPYDPEGNWADHWSVPLVELSRTLGHSYGHTSLLPWSSGRP